MRKRATLSCLLAAAAAASGCGGGSASSGTRSVASTPAAPATTASTPAGATGAPAGPGAAHSAAGFEGVPIYQPSRTIKRSSGSLFLSSPNSYADVSSYYASALANQGWVTVSKESIPQGEIITVRRGTIVASVELAPKGSGASISIAAYSAG